MRIATDQAGLSEAKQALLAKLMSERKIGRPAPAAVPLRPDRQWAPLSYSQRSLWFLNHLEGPSSNYNMGGGVRLRGALSVTALDGALAAVIERHEILRTVFLNTDAGPQQRILDHLAIGFDKHEIAGVEGEAGMLDRARARISAALGEPFDLERGPLLKALLIRLGDDDHIVYFVAHHIVADGWSINLLLSELSQAYLAKKAGLPDPFAPLALQFGDYAAWETGEARQRVVARQLDYWAGKLDGVPCDLPFPSDFPRSPHQSLKAGQHLFTISAELTARVQSLAKRTGTTVYLVLLSAYMLLLARGSGQDDVVVATSAVNRQRKELEALIGFFVNTLPIRAQVQPSMSFEGWLAEVRRALVEAFENQEVPFERIVDATRTAGEGEAAAIGQARFAYAGLPAQAVSLPGLECHPIEVELDDIHAKSDLLLAMWPADGVLKGSLQYRADLFRAETAARFAERLATLLDAVCARPQARLADVSHLAPGETDLIGASSMTECDHGDAQSIPALVRAWADMRPEAPALVCGEEMLTYRELWGAAARLAAGLRARGLGAGDFIGLCTGKTPEFAVGMLAILLIGAAYIPLDPKTPVPRMRRLVDDASARLVLLGRETQELSEALGTDTCLIGPAGPTDSHPAALDLPDVDPDQTAYLIYTSGSTGVPRGVRVTHRSIFNYVKGLAGILALDPGAEFLALSTLSADLGNTAIFGALCGGGCLRLVPEHASLDPQLLARCLAVRPVDCLKIVPSHFDMLLRAGDPADLLPRKCLVFGGERLGADLVRRVREYAPGLRIINHYGPTETTIGVLVDILSEDSPAAEPVPLGRPLPNVAAHVLDASLNSVGVGELGELYLGGACLAQGYAGAPAATAERFIPDPFGIEPGGRLYKTGDLARFDAEGKISFCGRRDHQVKIRGHRVELGEAEAAIRSLAGVRDCAVLTTTGDNVAAGLVAFIVPAGSSDGRALADELRGHVPEYMVPGEIRFVDALPLTSNGKVDRRRLAALAEAGRVVPEAPAERAELKDEIRQIWSEVLERPEIDDDQSFFDIGGHSLLATLAVFRLRQSVAPDLSVRELFENPTVTRLAAHIASGPGAAVHGDGIEPQERPERIPLAFTQERLWFADQIAKGTTAYNVPLGIRMKGDLDKAAMESALLAIIDRHESLRTTFESEGGVPVQVIAPEARLSLTEEYLGDAPPEQSRQMVERAIRHEVVTSFDLEAGPLVRVRLLTLSGTEHVLLLTMHHIISDGWSNEIISREFAELYTAFAGNRSSRLAPLALQYADFALWERQRHADGHLDEQLAYWRDRLAGAPDQLPLPTDEGLGSAPPNAGRTERFGIAPGALQRLRELCSEEGITPFVALQSIFKILLAQYSGARDIVIGTTHANRARPEFEPVVGFFVNQVPLRSTIDDAQTFRDLLRREKESVAADLAHHELPFNLLVSAVARERRLDKSPVFRVLFVLQNVPHQEFALPGLALERIDFEVTEAKFDISLFVTEREDGLEGAFIYKAALFRESTMRKLASRFVTLAERAISSPDTTVGSMNMIYPDERVEAADALARVEAAKVGSLRSSRRRAVGAQGRDLVTATVLDAEKGFPLCIRPAQGDVDLVAWAGQHRSYVESLMLQYGAVLFRGFRSGSSKLDFEALAASLSDRLIDEYGDLPRESDSGRVYKSTPYPADQPILIHNESSHLHRWPTKIFFSCEIPAAVGGETPIVDCRKLYERLDGEIVEKLQRKKLSYVRNYIEGVDVSWQHFFRTEDRQVVEAYCRANDIEFEWLADGNLRTRVTCEAVRRHPRTGEPVFFNQICLHHISCVEPSTRASLLQLYGPGGLPRAVYYGDGEPIEDEVVAAVRAAVDELAVAFPWERGDIIALDNILCAHARNPFAGERKIIVAIADLLDDRLLA
jgi:amino acid adenylation domain-containing protein